jgi:SAM-dependent methyltransferase
MKQQSAGLDLKPIKRALTPIFKPTRSIVAPTLVASALSHPLLFECWFRARMLWHKLTFRPRQLSAEEFTGNAEQYISVVEHNKNHYYEWHRTRTERMMAVLRCIESIPHDAKVLVIGPRNEAELLLLSLYGFRLKNITGVDLFTRSPAIQCMDMHKLTFPDSTFDVVYSAWTLSYSHDMQRACSEIRRVIKSGGVVALGFTGRDDGVRPDINHTPLRFLDQLMQPFEQHVDWAYWKEVHSNSRHVGSETITSIFRLRK